MDLKEVRYRSETSEVRHPWELARLEIIIELIRKTTKGLDPSKVRIIDIGCGDTYMLEKFSIEFGFNEYFGVDTAFNEVHMSELGLKYKNTPIHVLNNLADVPAAPGHVSIVLLLDVVEHIEHDSAFLSDLVKRDIVDENTLFFITVPSYNFLFCNHDIFLDHFRRYSSVEMRDVLRNSGYKVLQRGYFFHLLLYARILQVLKEKLTGKRVEEYAGTDLVTWNKGEAVTGILKNILLLDFKISKVLHRFGIRVPGLSNYAVCKRSV